MCFQQGKKKFQGLYRVIWITLKMQEHLKYWTWTDVKRLVLLKVTQILKYTHILKTCQNTAWKTALPGFKLPLHDTHSGKQWDLLRKSSHLPASFSSSSCGVDLRLLDRLPEGLRLLENHWLNRLADTGPSPKTSSIICKTKIGVHETWWETQMSRPKGVRTKVALTFRALSIDLAQSALEDWRQCHWMHCCLVLCWFNATN